MMNRFKAAVAAILLLSAIGGAAEARVDDAAQRKALVVELMAIAPYGQADIERDLIKAVTDGLRTAYGERFSPYAEQEATAAARKLFSEMPALEGIVVTTLVEKLTADELRQVIRFTNSPLAVKLRATEAQINAAPTEAAREELILETFTPAEINEMSAMLSDPAMSKYMKVLTEAAQPIGEKLADKLFPTLAERCPKRTAALPWCE